MYRYHITPQAYSVWLQMSGAYWTGELQDCDFVQIALLSN